MREKEYLTRIQYGNADPSGCRSLLARRRPRISAMEQVDFLRKLCRNELRSRSSINVWSGYHDRRGRARLDLRAKTDGRRVSTPQIGWWVGWVGNADRGCSRYRHRSPGGTEGCAETGGDCPIDTRSHFRAETCTGFFMVHLTFVNRSPSRFVTG